MAAHGERARHQAQDSRCACCAVAAQRRKQLLLHRVLHRSVQLRPCNTAETLAGCCIPRLPSLCMNRQLLRTTAAIIKHEPIAAA